MTEEQKTNEKTETDKPKTKEKKVKDWKCKTCGKENPATVGRCPKCHILKTSLLE